jgi:hypothetical protein
MGKKMERKEKNKEKKEMVDLSLMERYEKNHWTGEEVQRIEKAKKEKPHE